jgi:hypothetical protein
MVLLRADPSALCRLRRTRPYARGIRRLGLAENMAKRHVTTLLKQLDGHSPTQAAVPVKALEPEGEGEPPRREHFLRRPDTRCYALAPALPAGGKGSPTMPIRNEQIAYYPFLQEMLDDDYFPSFLVGKGQKILLRLCEAIEAQAPPDLPALYRLTHAATEEFNALALEFEAHDSEIETAARDNIGVDFLHIAKTYGFDAADAEELIAPREW